MVQSHQHIFVQWHARACVRVPQHSPPRLRRRGFTARHWPARHTVRQRIVVHIVDARHHYYYYYVFVRVVLLLKLEVDVSRARAQLL